MPRFPSISITRPSSATFRGWGFVIVAGLALAVIALLDRGGLQNLEAAADGSTGCQLQVAAEELNVRSGPSQDASLVETLRRGATVDGTRVVTDGFRELKDGRWAANQFLTPVPGAVCD